MDRTPPKIIAVILSYHCARLLAKAYAKIPQDAVTEILVTDDGSTDDSVAVAESLGLPVYRHTPNRGYGGNLKAGICAALDRGADYIVEVHGDGQFDPAAIRAALPLMERGVEFILGSRFRVPGRARALGMPWSRYLANRGLSFFDRLVLRLPFTEFHTGFRIYRRSFLARVPWEQNADDYLFSFQIIAQAAYARATTGEVPVEADYRGEHQSHSIGGAARYAFQTFWVLLQYLLARIGVLYTRCFPKLAPRPGADHECRGCGARTLSPLFHLGLIPPVNAFHRPNEAAQESGYPLEMVWCRSCHLVQLADVVPPAALFTTYQHLSSASQSNVAHLQKLAALLIERCAVTQASRVLEIGCNDGTLLAAFHGRVGTRIGVDPAQNLAPLAQAKGIVTVSTFFTDAVAADLVRTHGAFDLILALNVVAHTPDVNALLRAVAQALAPGGTFVMESVYLFDTILKGEFDTVYHEHVYCFSFTALHALLTRTGLAIVDVERIATQGGSLRVSAQRADIHPVAHTTVAALLAEERRIGVDNPLRYARVAADVRRYQTQLRHAVERLRARHGRVYGLGAPARGVVILNYCGIGPDLVEAVIDDTPLKQGCVVPGVRIPVLPWECLAQRRPPTAYLLLSWNYPREIFRKLLCHVDTAEVLIPFPQIHCQLIGHEKTRLIPEPNASNED